MFRKFIILFIILILLTQFSINYNITTIGSNNNSISKFSYNNEFLNEHNKLLNIFTKLFTKNLGQIENENVKFYTPNRALWFSNDGVWFEIKKEIEINNQEFDLRKQELDDKWGMKEKLKPFNLIKSEKIILKQEFINANNVEPVGKKLSNWNNSFFYGNNSSKWCTKVPNYKEIYYENLYNGIDLRYYVKNNELKYDFIVHPYADITEIRLKWNGAKNLRFDKFENLRIETRFEDIVDMKPYIYQEYGGDSYSIEGKFKIFDKNEYGFELLQDFNRQEILVIDPTVKLEYSTYINGNNFDGVWDIAIDLEGNVFITGSTNSLNFPSTPGTFDQTYNYGNGDIFISKVNNNGTKLFYSTYIGGNGIEWGNGISVDSTGNAYVTGNTTSNNFPTTNKSFDRSYNGEIDTFILKINTIGSKLMYSTYIGGNGSEFGWDIGVNSKGNAFITGSTTSIDFPITSGAYDTEKDGTGDVFVLKLNQTGSKLIFSTYVGGHKSEDGYDLSIDSSGNVYVTGCTNSSDFPTSIASYDAIFNGVRDCFVFKLNYQGSKLIYSTYIGGTKFDEGWDIIIDEENNAYVTGCTNSSNFPTTKDSFDTSYGGSDSIEYYDGFILKFSKTGSLIFSTFIGGSLDEFGMGIAIDSLNDIYITGYTDSSDFPTTSNAYDNSFSNGEGFLVKLISNGSTLIYSTFFGGSLWDFAHDMVLDSSRNAYISGWTESLDFPITPGAINSSFGGYKDVFVIKFHFQPDINISSVSLLMNNSPTNIIYSRLNHYTFRIKLIDNVSLFDLENVSLSLDPTNNNIQLLWNQYSGKFQKISDPNNMVNLESSSKAYNDFRNKWIIDFNITFNWTYSNEDFQDVQIRATSSKLSSVWLNVTNLFRIENDLEFNGTLSVKGENNRLLKNNDFVQGGEELIWSGLTPVYEDSNNIFPPQSEYNITIWDGIGNHWSTSPATGDFFKLKTYAPNNTNLKGDLHIINITGIPPTSDASNTSFSIRIDGDNVTFFNPKPNNQTWHIDETVVVGINIEDHGGGLVDGSSIMYAISTDNGESYDEWLPTPKLKNDLIIKTQTLVTLKNGRNNFIKWRALDSLGNGPSESQSYRVLVDNEEVVFSNPWPSVSYLSFSSTVEVGIEIFDNISGVNGSRVEYSISENDGLSWNDWIPVTDIESSNNISVRLNITLSPGTNNKIRWRSYDIAGNGPTKSDEYIINVWQSKEIPRINLISPSNGSLITNSSVNLQWEIEKPNNLEVTFNVVIDSFNPPNKVLISNLSNTNYRIDNLWDGVSFYWKIVPIINGIDYYDLSSEIRWFTIDLSIQPFEKIYEVNISGPKYISIYPGEKENVTLTITNHGNIEDNIKIKIEKGNLSYYVKLNDNLPLRLSIGNFKNRTLIIELPETIQPGIYWINIMAISLNSNETIIDIHKIKLDIMDLNDTKPNDFIPASNEKPNIWVWYLIISITIIFIILTTLLILLKKHSKKKPPSPKENTSKSFTTSIPDINKNQSDKKSSESLNIIQKDNSHEKLMPSHTLSNLTTLSPINQQTNHQQEQKE